jgi:hypothetical protein
MRRSGGRGPEIVIYALLALGAILLLMLALARTEMSGRDDVLLDGGTARTASLVSAGWQSFSSRK